MHANYICPNDIHDAHERRKKIKVKKKSSLTGRENSTSDGVICKYMSKKFHFHDIIRSRKNGYWLAGLFSTVSGSMVILSHIMIQHPSDELNERHAK